MKVLKRETAVNKRWLLAGGSLLLAAILLAAYATAPVRAVIETVRDEFATSTYNNQDGSQNWTSDWIETNDDGTATTGNIRIIAGPQTLLLEGSTTAPVRAIQRQFDLTGAVSADFSFDWRCIGTMENADYLNVQISDDGGGSWTTLQTKIGNTDMCIGGDDNGSESFDVAALIDGDPSDSLIRFEYSFDETAEDLRIDNVEVAYDIPDTPTPNEINGNVYRDYDNDGVDDTLEPGVAGVIVTAYLNDGSVVDTTTTDAAGDYTLNVTDTVQVRIEFTGLPSNLNPGPAGLSSLTTVTFVTSPADNIDMGIHNPAQYCNNDGDLVTSCFVNGRAVNTTGGPNDVLVRWDYSLRGDTTMPTHISERVHIGSTWGLAYDRINEELYASAFLKRYVGLNNGLGAIFVTDPLTTTANGSLFLDMSAAPFNLDVGEIGDDISRGLPLSPTVQSNDPTAFFQIGKVGLGDLDISEDYQTLWFVNLFDKTVYSLEIDSDGDPGTLPGAADLSSFPLPTAQCASYTTLRINASSSVFTSLVDGGWNGDAYFIGGTAGTAVGAPGAPYDTNRSDASFDYMIPVPDGTYSVTLYAFATTGRTFDVTAEGNLQPVTLVANTAYSETRSVTVTDSLMNLTFDNGIGDNPIISGIEISAGGGVQFNEAHPFTLDINDGDVYAGVICTAEYSQDAAQLEAYIYRLAGGSLPFQQVVTFALDYPKGDASSRPNCGGAISAWHPWATSLPAECDLLDRTVWPQPMLSGIDFDTDGSMIVGFMDRLGHQLGNFNYAPVGTDVREGVIGGDLVRLYNNSGVYELESNGSAGPLTASWLTADNGVGNGQGNGGGEFYQDDASPPRTHEETPVGGIYHWLGLGEIAVTTMDPLGDAESGGVLFFNNTRGSSTTSSLDTSFDGYEVYQSSDVSTFGKANGIGDLEMICELADIEIGNRVWHDVDGDGVQDAAEPPLAGVTVNLYQADGTFLGASVTDSEGQYLFNDTVITGGLSFTTDYVIRIDDLAPITSTGLTALSPPNSDLDLRDTDATMSNVLGLANGNRPEIQVTTGTNGQNNHTYDFGFNNVPTAVTLNTLTAPQPAWLPLLVGFLLLLLLTTAVLYRRRV